MTFNVLKEKIEEICTWLRGSDFDFFYHTCGTSPKEYAFLSNDVEVDEMLSLCIASDRAEIVVVACDDREVGVALEGPQRRDCTDMVDCISTYNTEIVSSNDLVIGARFRDCQSFKQVLRTNTITHNFGVKMKASNKTRIMAICSHQCCLWRVRAALCVDGQTFEVRKLDPIHSCPGVNRAGNKLATNSWIANKIEDIVRKNPDISPKQINNNLETTYGLSQPYMKLWRSREQARERIFGAVDANYSWVPSLREELIRGNPGSYITYTCTPHDSAFKQFYICFKVSVDDFLAGCRHLVGVDACHLKSKYLGVLLATNSLDGNKMAYESPFSPLPGKDQWRTVDNGVVVGVPHSLRPRGKPKKRRLKNFLEGNSSSGKSVHKCSRCGFWGHHRTTCKNPLAQSGSQQLEVCSIASPESMAPDNMFRAKLPIRREYNSLGSCSLGYDVASND